MPTRCMPQNYTTTLRHIIKAIFSSHHFLSFLCWWRQGIIFVFFFDEKKILKNLAYMPVMKKVIFTNLYTCREKVFKK